jgi:hypothetical protein
VLAWSRVLHTSLYPRQMTGETQTYGGINLNKIHGVVIGSALAALLSGCGTPTTSSRPIDPEKLAKVDCADLKFSAEFLQKYPDAPAACIEAREYNGKRYAKFQAKVYLNSADRTTVTLLDPAGKDLSTFSFRPSPTTVLKINGESKKFTQLNPGEKISFWVSEDRMTASALPASTEDSWAVLPPID